MEKERERTKYEQEMLKAGIFALKKDYEGLPILRDSGGFLLWTRRGENSGGGGKKNGVPVVAIVDTNTDPRPIDYIIPANDDAQKSVAYILGKITESLLRKK